VNFCNGRVEMFAGINNLFGEDFWAQVRDEGLFCPLKTIAPKTGDGNLSCIPEDFECPIKTTRLKCPKRTRGPSLRDPRAARFSRAWELLACWRPRGRSLRHSGNFL
jgi:hypothetical protein